MTNYREILRLKNLGLNNSQITAGTGISRPTVINALQKAAEHSVSWQTAAELSDRELAALLFGTKNGSPAYKMPDYEYVHREMAKAGVTLSLLWVEYCDKCRTEQEIPYQFTQFKKYYRDFLLKTKATMHINRKPGEIMEVDWAGQTAGIIDTDTGEVIPAYIFVAALPYSGYAYVEAFLSRNQGEWITAHVNAYSYIGGVTRILVSDNLKTGVIKNTRTETILNKTYQEMAEHYGTAVIPARVYTPKDKATVEGSVGIISTWILAAVRNQQFLSLSELNTAIVERLHDFNHKPFQKKDGSRASLFKEEKPFLLPLPKANFEMSEWKIATVGYNYHINVDCQNYSVPFEYIKQSVNVRITRNVIEVFFEGNRICSHVRKYGKPSQYSTTEAHMPPDHQKYTEWNGDRFRNWASKIGVHTAAVIEVLLTSNKVEQQGYKSCMALLKLADKHSVVRLEAACERALGYTPRPSYKSVAAILKSGQDKLPTEPEPTSSASEYGITRGAGYYGGAANVD